MTNISEESQELLDAFDNAVQKLAVAPMATTPAYYKQAQQKQGDAKEALTQRIHELEQAAGWANYD